MLGGYMIATGVLALFNAATGWLVMTLLGLPLALPVAILSFFGGFIPYIGQFVTSLIGFLVAVAFGTTQDVVIMGIFTAVFNVVQGSVIAPLVYGRAVSLHPAIVLIVIPAGGELAGILGMFLAVPLVGIIGAVWRHILAAIGEVPPATPEEIEPDDGAARHDRCAGAAAEQRPGVTERRHGAAMTEHQVVIAGGGPTGLMLAAELELAGIDVLVVERRVDQELDGKRAGGLHARTLEVLDQRGVADRFVSAGRTHPFVGYGGTSLDISDFPTRHPYVLALWQKDIEVILAGWVDELGVPMLREHEVPGVHPGRGPAWTSTCPGGRRSGPGYLVGCDGGRSVVRKTAGIDFAGFDASRSYLIAEVEMDEPPPIGMRPEGGGIGPVDREKGGSPYGVVLLEAEVEHASEPTMEDLRAALIAAYGTDYGAHDPTRLSRFTDADAPGRVLSRRAASCSPATPRTCTVRWAARASTSACRTP